MNLSILNLIEVLKDVVLHSTRELFDSTVENVKRFCAHPEGKAVDVHCSVGTDTSAVGAELLEPERKGWSNELLPVQRRVRDD